MSKKSNELQTAVATGAVTLGIAALAAPSADAATFNVTNLNDSGAGSLRQATLDANAAAGADVITFQSGLSGTITLTSGQLELYDSVDIQGPGPATLTVSGNNASRVFYIYSPANTPIDVTISGLTISGGTDPSSGGGIVDFSENLTLDNDVITNNTTGGSGGGVAKEQLAGTLTVLNSTISGNQAGEGGGIYLYNADAPVTIQDSVISNNTAVGSGGGIYFYSTQGDITISRTTISGNSAGCCGGGIFLYDTDGGSLIVDSSTISGNTASFAGGGIYLYGPDDPVSFVNSTIHGNQAQYVGGIFALNVPAATLSFTTVSGNTATGDVGGVFLYAVGSNMQLENSIIADNTSPNVNDATGGGTFTLDYSLIEDPDVEATLVLNAGAITGQDPALGPLQNNGGPTLTQLPDPGSIVIDAGDPAYAPPPATDQRGLPRKMGVNVDMGAVETVNGGTIQFSAATYSVNENGGMRTITVTRTGGTDPATIDYTTSNGSAAAGADYTTTSGTINFIAGQTSATFDVPILDDALVEGNETFNLALSNPSAGATLGAQSTAVVTIVDVEPGVLEFSSATYTVNENGGSITITVNRTNGSTEAVAVNYFTSNGTATAGSDYTSTSGTLNFAIGQTSNTFNVPILDDAMLEGNETINLTLTSPTNGASIGAQGTAIVTITDVEAGQLQFSSATYTVNENGGSITITVNRTNGATNAVAVNYATSNGSATAGSDYTTTNGTLNFGIGQTSATFNIPILDDALVEGNETINLTLSAPTNGAILGAQSTAVVTIDDFESGTLQFSAPSAQIQEGQGPLVITVTRTGGSDGPLVATYSTSNGTATAPADYTATAGTITFADGDTAPQTITIPITNDGLSEPPENFTVTLSGAGSVGSPASLNATIIDPAAAIPLLDNLGKMLLALFTAIAGLFVINRNRMMGVLFAILLIGATAAPAHAAGKNQFRQKHGGRWNGTLESVVNNGDSLTLHLTNGSAPVVPVSKLRVVDLRGTKHERKSPQDLAAGMKVKVVLKTNASGQIVQAKIKILKN